MPRSEKSLSVRARKWLRRPYGAPGYRPLPAAELHEYWRNPPKHENQPEQYLSVTPDRSEFLVGLLRELGFPSDASILEVGCNAGRNLAYLCDRQWRDLHAIEISADPIGAFETAHPAAARATNIRQGALELMLPEIPSGTFDVVFSMAVLEHIHYDSDFVLDHIARVSKRFVVTIEDEETVSEPHFPRNYREAFQQERGLRQVSERRPVPGLPRGFVARAFARG